MKPKSRQCRSPAVETEEAAEEAVATKTMGTKIVPNPIRVIRVRAEAPDTPISLPGRPARSTGSSGRPPGYVPTVTIVLGGTTRTLVHVTTEILPVLK